MPDPKFIVRKKYLDCVADDGSTIIGYVAHLTWLGITVPYTSLLYVDPHGGVRRKERFFKPVEPETQPGSLEWKDPKLGISGTWKSTSSAIEETLFDSRWGKLQWNSHFPRASAVVHLADEPDLKGFGYVEDLTLTAFPWKIPLETLLWGRYLSERHYLIWIEFRARSTKNWTYFDDTPLQKVAIEEKTIDLQNGLVLRFSETRVLEQGRRILEIVERLNEHLPGLGKIMPHSFLNAQEWKWRSQGVLCKKQEIIDHGWIIHEKVMFK